MLKVLAQLLILRLKSVDPLLKRVNAPLKRRNPLRQIRRDLDLQVVPPHAARIAEVIQLELAG